MVELLHIFKYVYIYIDIKNNNNKTPIIDEK